MISMTLLMCVDFSDTKYSLFKEFLPWCFMMRDTIAAKYPYFIKQFSENGLSLPIGEPRDSRPLTLSQMETFT